MSAGYDVNTGLIVHFTDQNNQTTYYGYDYARRPTSFTYPDGGQRSVTYNDSTPNPSLTVSTLISSTIGSTSRKVTFDGVGRTIKSALTSDPEGTDYGDTTYDAVGNVYVVSDPYRSTGESTYGVTTYRYDGLKRKTLEIPADGSASADNIQTSYNSNQVTVQDEAGKTRTTQYDALGRLTYVWEAGTTYETDYQYDALSNLTLAQQKGDAPTDQTKWRKRTFAYDPLSRLTQANNPESNNRFYRYVRTDGTLCSPQTASACQRTDAIGNVTTYTFDALARPVGTSYSVHSPTASTPSVTNYYDQTSYNGLTIAYGTGHRTGMADGSGNTAWSYDVMGRTVNTLKTIAGDAGYISYSYNLDGSLASLLDPDGDFVAYNYSPAGRVVSASYDDLGSGYNFFENATYTAAGALKSYQNDSGAMVTNAYNSRLQPATQSVAVSQQTIFYLTYNFNLGSGDNGNVFGITNNNDSTRSQTFAYDSLNRLSTAGTSSTWGNSYGYDPWGNLLSKTVTQGSGETWSNAVDANNRMAGSWGYDGDGNLTSLNGIPYDVYNAENQWLSQSNYNVSYLYDGDGKKVQSSGGASGTRIYWYDQAGQVIMESMQGGSGFLNEYLYVGGQRVARVANLGPIYYYYGDHLGTARLITDGGEPSATMPTIFLGAESNMFM